MYYNLICIFICTPILVKSGCYNTLAEGERAMDGESLIDFILILCLYNALIYSYVIHVVGIPCLMA
jgi:hypothetical protein